MRKIALLNRFKINKNLFSDKILIAFLSLCAIFGMILGLLGIDKRFSFNVDFSLKFGIDNMLSNSFFDVCAKSLSTYFIFMTVIFLLGISVWGFLAVPVVIAYKGYGIGFLSGYLTVVFGLNGFILYAMVILLGAFVSTLAMAIAGAESMKMSFNICKLVSPKSNVNQRMFSSIRRFLTKLAKVLLVLFISAAIDGLMSVLFSRFLSALNV